MKKHNKNNKGKTTAKRAHPVASVMRAMDLPEETDSGIVKITVLGHRRALVENHRGIYAYTQNGLSLEGEEGIISISGTNLEIRHLDSGRIAVEGYITGVLYE